MSSSMRQKLRGSFVVRRRALVALVTMAAMLVPCVGWADTTYSIAWAITQENPACETAALGAHNGDPFFRVNQMPLPGFEVPGALMTHADGSETNTVETGFKSVLLRTGANTFHFQVSNTNG